MEKEHILAPDHDGEPSDDFKLPPLFEDMPPLFEDMPPLIEELPPEIDPPCN